MKRLSPLLLLALLAAFGHGCVKETYDLEQLDDELAFNPSLAISLGSAYMTLQSFVDNGDEFVEVIEVYADAEDAYLIHLLYRDTVWSAQAQELLALPDVAFSRDWASKSVAATDVVALDFGEGRSLSRLDLKGGLLRLSATSALPGSAQVSIPSLTDAAGQPFSATLSFNAAQPTVLDLAGYSLGLEHQGERDRLVLEYEFSQKDAQAQAQVSFAMEDLRFSRIQGLFEPFGVELGQADISVGLYDSFDLLAMYFEEPLIRAEVVNSFGIPVRVDFLTATNDRGEVLQLLAANQDNTAPAMGTTQVLFDKDRVNGLLEFINELNNDDYASREKIFIAMEGTVNPGGQAAEGFLLDTSRLSIRAYIDLPVHGHATVATVRDTLAFDMSQFFDSTSTGYDQYVESAIFRFNFSNMMPIRMRPEIILGGYSIGANGDTLRDANGQPVVVGIDTLLRLDEVFLEPGTDPDGDGVVNQAYVHPPLDFVFDRERVERLKQGRYFLLRGQAATTDAPARSVKFFATYGLGVQIGVQVNLQGSTSDL